MLAFHHWGHLVDPTASRPIASEPSSGGSAALLGKLFFQWTHPNVCNLLQYLAIRSDEVDSVGGTAVNILTIINTINFENPSKLLHRTSSSSPGVSRSNEISQPCRHAIETSSQIPENETANAEGRPVPNQALAALPRAQVSFAVLSCSTKMDELSMPHMQRCNGHY
ncbi:hypothetical protein CSOJ01_12270 [Colletotrichum sojae]|uniref:Uncharacterized protein n=1 Tax=Colletotrichum sojae TaxID=2175907 RepID=A0A8H6IW10_9PEZI|nr:hypothetical protein CSOJ01_12270 [Colletotrichum sojae]